ncbi:hypothetical protein Cfor_11969 [Coptotermes formosanus]|uniref:Helix-turn-helix domain-containing protein n=1 Tax=Coptotermes formosanus TaxID=36987 RepID=A0A6L2PH78_COPFO|nr:hypothetical protein Cfor_11969 [Coptotermes formosanus]
METEKEDHLPFQDIDICRRPDGSLGRKVYRKTTHTNLCLKPASHHHPSIKQAVLSTLVHRARALCDKEGLHELLELLKTTFRENGYSLKQIQRALNSAVRTPKSNDKPTSVALLPYVQITYSRISRMLAKRNISSVGLPPRKISSFLRPVKDDLGLRIFGVYSIPCECGQVYIGQTG